MAPNPPPFPPPAKPQSRLRAFWQARSWKGKTALIVGAVFLLLLVIGLAVPSEPTAEDVASPTTTAETQDIDAKQKRRLRRRPHHENVT